MATEAQIDVALMCRRPRAGSNFSVEHIVDSIIEHLGTEFVPRKAVSRFESNGFFRRLYNVVEAALRQGNVNHVTGDVHFLTYLLDKRKTVLTVLDCNRIGGEQDIRKVLIRYLWFTIPVRRCAAITVISHAVKRDLLRHVDVDPDKIHVVPVAVPTVYKHVPKPFNSERPTLLQVGTAAHKNLPRLCEAIEGIPCKLDIIGVLNDEQRALLERHSIDFTNYVSLTNDEMLERYAASDIVCFVSLVEGFGMPIIEGNLTGRPVITANTTSMPEVAGDGAHVVDPTDVGAIRDGILRLINDVAYREGLVNRGFVNALRYDSHTITSRYAELYREVAQKDLLPRWKRFSSPVSPGLSVVTS